jgi:glycosyltransferase involved in cell wall biosynthesis
MSTARIIAFAPNDWDGVWMNRQQLLSRLAVSYPTLYSTGVRSTWDPGFWRWGAGGLLGRFVSRGHVTVDLAPALVLRVPRLALWDAWTMRIAAWRWRKRLQRLSPGPTIAYLFHTIYYPYVEALRPDYIVCHAYDLYWRSDGARAPFEPQHLKVLQAANLVVASSKVIADELATASGRRVHTLPNAVDYEAFARRCSSAEPADISNIPHPRVGYVGRISRKVDIDLIVALAERHPVWSLVLVGPVVDLSSDDQAVYERARSMKNIHFLGMKPREELPRYMQALDVGLLAYREHTLWVEGIYPLKLHEYLAAGLPIVGIDLQATREFSDVVRTASTLDEWSAAIAAAISDKSAEQRELRQATARACSWDRRVEVLKGLLDEMLARA